MLLKKKQRALSCSFKGEGTGRGREGNVFSFNLKAWTMYFSYSETHLTFEYM